MAPYSAGSAALHRPASPPICPALAIWPWWLGGCMRALALAVLMSAALAAPVLSQPADGPSRVLRGEDLFSLQYAADPQVRPDGGTVAYVRVSNDVMTDHARRSIWLVDP